MIKINHIGHGGIMVNYQCNAACRHCLYACSPKRDSGYMNEETAKKVAMILRKNGCCSVHIGGGEPFLQFDKLINVIKVFNKCGLTIDYIETNGFWAKDEKRAKEYLDTLYDYGIDALCISLDPFHAEYVAPALPLKLTEYCRKYNMGFFLWKQEFLKPLSKLDLYSKHTREEFEGAISQNYIKEMADYYGIYYGGRAINIEEEYGDLLPLERLISSSPCRNLTSTNHYHIDYMGRFIPPRCTGIYIPIDKAVSGIDTEKYKIFSKLYKGGVKSLYDFAIINGFTAQKSYSSTCDLCFSIREFLSKTGKFPELNAEHYEQSRAYYT